MKTFVTKIFRVAITLLQVLITAIAIFRAWSFYTESPWTRDAKFTADVVAIEPDVGGLLSEVPIRDNQRAKKQLEVARRRSLGTNAMSQEQIDQASNDYSTVSHQLAKAIAVRNLAKLDLARTEVRAPADCWVTNLNGRGAAGLSRGDHAPWQ